METAIFTIYEFNKIYKSNDAKLLSRFSLTYIVVYMVKLNFFLMR
jgi:hypothetical protein